MQLAAIEATIPTKLKKEFPTLQLCSKSRQEEGSGEITAESTYARVGRLI